MIKRAELLTMNNSLQKKGVIYCRVSSLEQIDGTSLESQERLCKEYALKHDIFVDKDHIFIEKGESAKTANRTEFQKVLALCCSKKSKIDYFIVYKIDRFARNQNDHAITTTMLKKYGTSLRSVTEPINDTTTGKMMEGIISVFAEFDNNVRTERSRNGMAERLKQGVWVWQCPLGYERLNPKDNITPDGVISPFIVMCFEEYSKGKYTYQSLADYINTKGFKSRQGNKATAQQIEKILKNKLYCGVMKGLGFEYEGKYTPLVSKQLFNECQPGYKTESRRRPHNAKNPLFPLRSVVMCSHCKQPITGSTSTGNKQRKYSYYHHHKQTCPQARFITKEDFEKLFVEHLDKIVPKEEYLALFKAVIMDIWKSNYVAFNEENDKLRQEIKETEKRVESIFDCYERGVYTDKEFLERKNRLNREISEKESRIHENRVEKFDMDEALEYCFNFIRNASTIWKQIKDTPELVNSFQKLIFKEKLPFEIDGFGNSELATIYKLEKEFDEDKSSLVTLRRIELRFQA